jgi:vacuolar-type H+-ATPase subunit H
MTVNARKLIAHASRGVFLVRPGGLDAKAFALSAAGLAKTMHRVATISRNQTAHRIALKARVAIRQHVASIIEAGQWGGKSGISLAEFWEPAIIAASKERAGDLSRAAFEDSQRIISQSYSRIAMLLGQPERQPPSTWIKPARELADRLLKPMEETTQRQFKEAIAKADKEGMTRQESAQFAKDEVERKATSRANTAGNVVAQQGWQEGSIPAMQEGNVVEVSVIGCMSREEDQWGSISYQDYMFDADGRSPESSCNIEDVPIGFADKLFFHPGHTGTIVASKFKA